MTTIDRRRLLGAMLTVGGSVTSYAIAGGGPLLATTLDDNARHILAAQILNGATPEPIEIIDRFYQSIAEEFSEDVLDRLIEAILARDAGNIDVPFEDAEIDAAAQRMLEIFYTGEVTVGGQKQTLYFHQALAWHVLRFTKPPSICGPGFGWWADEPVTVSEAQKGAS